MFILLLIYLAIPVGLFLFCWAIRDFIFFLYYDFDVNDIFDFFDNKNIKKYSDGEFFDEFEEENKNIFSSSKNILILLIESDLELLKLISAHLEYSGFKILKAGDGIKGKALALKYSPDLILLDLMLLKVDGLTLCQRLRRDERTSNIPILMLTALGGIKDKVTGYKSGADDYITKPFDFEDLIVRVQGLLRKNNRLKLNYFNQQKVLNYGPLKLDPDEFDMIWFKNRISLSALEYVLLSFLLQSHGQIVSKELILNEMKYWDKNKIYWRDKNINRIKILIMNLRKKLEPDPLKPKYIKTIYGKGYCLLLD